MKKIACIVFCLVSFWSCQNKSVDSPTSDNVTQRGMYFWKTTFVLNDYERDFLRKHKINKLYVRMFDVDVDENNVPIPIATIRFIDSIPSGIEIIPVVYLTTKAVANMEHKSLYAEKILDRVYAMFSYNNLGTIFQELQYDCDWTKTTQNDFFELCKETKTRLYKTQKLCSTIRLHQLSQKKPPVDKGVLMLYNTGGLRNYNEENSILKLNDVKNYIKSYSLPLDFAYPTFGWSVLFRNGDFKGILHTTDFDSSCYKKIDEHWYQVEKTHETLEAKLFLGDEIRTEQPDFQTIQKVKSLINTTFNTSYSTTILYHLDSVHLTKYSYENIEEIF